MRRAPKKQTSVEYLASLLTGGRNPSANPEQKPADRAGGAGKARRPPPKRNSSVERLATLFQKSFGFGGRRPTPTDLTVPELSDSRPTEVDCSGETAWAVFEKRYRIASTELLGQGAFSEVRPVVDNETGKTWACKIAAGPDETQHLVREARLLLELDHPNIVKCREFCRGPEGCYMVTELLEGKELLSSLSERGSYCEEDAREVMKQLVSAVAYLAKRGVAHRDLKLRNIMCVDASDHLTIKLIDFGLAGQLSKDKPHFTATCGTPHFSAPEVLRRRARYGVSCDVWSVGVVLYVLLVGDAPFKAKNVTDLITAVREGPLTFNDPAMQLITPEASALIAQLMELDTELRLTADKALEHEWMIKL